MNKFRVLLTRNRVWSVSTQKVDCHEENRDRDVFSSRNIFSGKKLWKMRESGKGRRLLYVVVTVVVAVVAVDVDVRMTDWKNSGLDGR